ncbi:Gti1/Pac2 family-domain-containing protein [Flagelloscypha sp. PMI_526]|nr:Gti1/Pac2 family-domain-containing protein [Flagelloscypha sp. PMI_526]
MAFFIDELRLESPPACVTVLKHPMMPSQFNTTNLVLPSDMNDNHVPLITFRGSVETTVHALRIIHAAHKGLIPRVTRRLSDNERQAYIRSGSVFVFSVQESGIKRWTDGLYWTPSRIVDNFLVYRELKEKGPPRNRTQKTSAQTSPFTTGTSRDYSQRLSEQPTIKDGGLIKKTISVPIENTELHLVAYYTGGRSNIWTTSEANCQRNHYAHPYGS